MYPLLLVTRPQQTDLTEVGCGLRSYADAVTAVAASHRALRLRSVLRAIGSVDSFDGLQPSLSHFRAATNQGVVSAPQLSTPHVVNGGEDPRDSGVELADDVDGTSSFRRERWVQGECTKVDCSVVTTAATTLWRTLCRAMWALLPSTPFSTTVGAATTLGAAAALSLAAAIVPGDGVGGGVVEAGGAGGYAGLPPHPLVVVIAAPSMVAVAVAAVMLVTVASGVNTYFLLQLPPAAAATSSSIAAAR